MDSVLSEKWFELSLVQQMINIGNEVKRALKFSSDLNKRNMFFDRAIQYSILENEQIKCELILSVGSCFFIIMYEVENDIKSCYVTRRRKR